MGLDLVELVLAIEEEFGVPIDDAEASRLATPGDVSKYLYARLKKSDDAPCLSQVAFYRLRKAIRQTFSVDRKAIRPNSSLTSIMAGNVKANWQALQNAVGANKFPRLQRKKPLFIFFVIVLPALAAIFISKPQTPITRLALNFAVVSTIINLMTMNMGTKIPISTSTIAQLVPYVPIPKPTAWSYSNVLERVIQLTSVQLGIPLDKIREDSHFVKDLGAD
jgi:acyl carrier protein